MKVVHILLTIIFVFLLIITAKSQTNIDCPSQMQIDSLNGASQRVTRDFWFNSWGDTSHIFLNNGSIDLDIYPKMTSVDSDDDTLTIEAYALKRKKVSTDSIETFATDSIRVTAALAVDTLLHSFALDALWGSDMPIMDGFRAVFKNNGSDADSIIIESNSRVYHKSILQQW